MTLEFKIFAFMDPYIWKLTPLIKTLYVIWKPALHSQGKTLQMISVRGWFFPYVHIRKEGVMCTLPSRGPRGVGSLGFLSTDNGAGGMGLTTMRAITDICAWLPPCASIQKTRIRETKHLSTDANSSTDAIGGWTKDTQKTQFFCKNGKITKNASLSAMSRNMTKLAIRPLTRCL